MVDRLTGTCSLLIGDGVRAPVYKSSGIVSSLRHEEISTVQHGAAHGSAKNRLGHPLSSFLE